MSRSWGHTLTPFTDEEAARRDGWAIRQYRENPERPLLGHDVEGRRLCSALSNCRNHAAWWATCHGSGGCMTEVLCDDHAARWCSRHAAMVREAASRPQTARAVVGVLVLDKEGS
jgi:hypothetical protein